MTAQQDKMVRDTRKKVAWQKHRDRLVAGGTEVGYLRRRDFYAAYELLDEEVQRLENLVKLRSGQEFLQRTLELKADLIDAQARVRELEAEKQKMRELLLDGEHPLL